MRLVLLGPPGAGKGTQAQLLSDALNIPHISTGDLFSTNISQGTELGKQAQEYMDAGKLVPTAVTASMVRARLERAMQPTASCWTDSRAPSSRPICSRRCSRRRT